MTRLVLVGVGMIGWSYQNPKSNWRGIDKSSGIRWSVVADQPLLDMWTRWDSWQYEEIARVGYWYNFHHEPRPYGTVACFPLYPLLVRGLGVILGGRYVLAGIVISNLAAWVGFVLLFQWASWSRDRQAAWLAVSAALAFPTGVFWGAVYPQSLFFALSVGTLTLMLDGRVAAASLACALATATRLEAVALIPCLVLIRLGQGGRRPVLRDLWFLTMPLGLVAYMAYLQANWGNPLLFVEVHKLFNRGLTNPILTLIDPGKYGGLGGREWIVFGTYVVLGLLIFGLFTKVRRPILLYGWLLFLIPLASGSYISIYRVHQVNPALYLIIGLGMSRGWRWFGWLLVVSSALIEAWLMFLWVIGYLLP